ncbi:hypothetical protein ABT297_41055 [Dactylosporangium sp. NPDC000555]|uniref:hypothetical protein n=1 Tax=Dactylosporangium sp. NPDC000555 TaxID=3154260 RepID=UPI00332F2C15
MDRTTGYTDSWYRQPSPVPSGDRPAPTSQEWAVIAASWLLAVWAGDGAPGWRTEVVVGAAPERSDQHWPEPPAPAEIARLGGFPESGPGRPVAANVLTSQVQAAPGRPYEPTRPDDEATAEVLALLRERIPVTGPRGGSLLAHLADQLVGRHSDLLRVSTGEDDLHLLRRDTFGKTLRLTVATAPAVEPPPVIEADGADAALRTHLACLMTLLSGLLWVNNNNPVTFRAWIGPRGDGDPLAVAADWWRRTREEEPEEVPELRTVSVDELSRGMEHVVSGSLLDLIDEDWEGEWLEIPDDHIAGHLHRDLLDVLLARMTGPDGPPLIAYAGWLPLNGPDDEPAAEDDFNGTVVFVNGTEAAVLDIDLTC